MLNELLRILFTMLNHGFMTGLKPETLLSMRNIDLQSAKGDIRTSVNWGSPLKNNPLPKKDGLWGIWCYLSGLSCLRSKCERDSKPAEIHLCPN